MNPDDIRAYARATARLGYAIERSGKIDQREYLETVDAAGRNPIVGISMMVDLATRAEVDYLALHIGDELADVPDDDGPTEASDEDQAIFKVAFVRALDKERHADKFVKVSEAAKAIDRTPLRVRQLINDGKLVAKRRGHLWMVSIKSIQDYLAARNK